MKGKIIINLAWILLIVSMLMGITAIVLFVFNADTILPASWGTAGGARNHPADWFNVVIQPLVVPFTAGLFGVLILKTQPRQPIGWLLLIIGFASALSMLASEWAVYVIFTIGRIDRLGPISAWTTNWIWVVIFGAVLTMLGIFPNGRFFSRGWRWASGLPIFLFTLMILISTTIETPMSSAYQIDNPFVQTPQEALYPILFYTGVGLMLLSTIMILAQFVVRYRGSTGRERQQLKWLLAGVVLFAFLVLIGITLVFAFDFDYGGVLVNVAIMAPLVGIVVAMVRHHLYDIDVIIRRTLVYATLSGALILIYFGVVILLQLVFDTLAGSQNSQLVVVISTLVIAALFRPLRLRIQSVIDRRFYRRKYNAGQTLARFAATTRDEVNLNVLTQELLHVVEETMQPDKVSIWLKNQDSA